MIGHEAYEITDRPARCKDVSPEWPGLTVDILYDIFGAHKALVFGRLQRSDYSPTEFMKNIEVAETKVLGNNICSQHISKGDTRMALSFYPEYLINDDVFEVMACHYAVSSTVRSMQKERKDLSGMHIISVVIPAATSSRYDLDVRYQSSITNLEQLTELNPSKCGVLTAFDSKQENVTKMAKQICNMINQFNADGVISKNTVIVFNRHRSTNPNKNTVCVFGFDDDNKLGEIDDN